MKKIAPVGIFDFKKIIEGDYYFVDKTLLIKEILDSQGEVILLPRPRRFGKTLNLSMLQYFFELTEQDKTNKHLFNGLKISQHKNIIKHQGKYPVVFMTFKDAKAESWELAYEKIKRIISLEYKRHIFLLDSGTLQTDEKKDFEQIINLSADQAAYEDSFKNLTMYLKKHLGVDPVLLIDEYDSPINASYINKYYKQIISFMRGFLGGGLKDNKNLKFAVITGILRVAKESIFSGVNNLEVHTMLSKSYEDKFGLLQEEVDELAKYYEHEDKLQELEDWYNGYKIGNVKVYNPWSIVNWAKFDGEFKPYWINTSANELIKKSIYKGSDAFKENVEQLISNESIEIEIDENIIFPDLDVNENVVWSLLFFSGYLTIDKINDSNKEEVKYFTKLPNKEVKIFYLNIIKTYFEERIGNKNYNYMLYELENGNIEEFKKYFYDFVIKSFSFVDTGCDEPEKIYHMFVLGMLVGLRWTHEIKSNRESGHGRHDVMVIPRDTSKIGIIFEFKKAYNKENESLEQAANAALKQIEEKKYETELCDRGIKKIIKLGIAFKGKEVLIKEGK